MVAGKLYRYYDNEKKGDNKVLKSMNKVANILFIAFNVILFAVNFALIDFFPKTLWFGWCPCQLGIFIVSMILASIVWGLYFVTFFNTQGHVHDKYKETGEEVQQ